MKKKKKWIIIVVVVVVLLVIISSNGGDDKSSDSAGKSDAAATTEQTAKSETDADTTDDSDDVESKSEDTGDASGEITPLSFYEALEDFENAPYEMTDKARTFLSEHPDVFPAKEDEDFIDYVNLDITYKQLDKNISKYGDELVWGSELYVISISEETVNDDLTMTTVQASDTESNFYLIYYMDELPDIYENDVIELYGLPLGQTSFDNVSGGTTLSIVFAGSRITKLNVEEE